MVGATVLSRFVSGSSKPTAIAENTTLAASKSFEVAKTEAEWRQMLTPEPFLSYDNREPNGQAVVPLTMNTAKEPIVAQAATCPSLPPKPNTKAVRVGPVVMPPLKTQSVPPWIGPLA